MLDSYNRKEIHEALDKVEEFGGSVVIVHNKDSKDTTYTNIRSFFKQPEKSGKKNRLANMLDSVGQELGRITGQVMVCNEKEDSDKMDNELKKMVLSAFDKGIEYAKERLSADEDEDEDEEDCDCENCASVPENGIGIKLTKENLGAVKEMVALLEKIGGVDNKQVARLKKVIAIIEKLED